MSERGQMLHRSEKLLDMLEKQMRTGEYRSLAPRTIWEIVDQLGRELDFRLAPHGTYQQLHDYVLTVQGARLLDSANWRRNRRLASKLPQATPVGDRCQYHEASVSSRFRDNPAWAELAWQAAIDDARWLAGLEGVPVEAKLAAVDRMEDAWAYYYKLLTGIDAAVVERRQRRARSNTGRAA